MRITIELTIEVHKKMLSFWKTLKNLQQMYVK